MKKLVSAIWVLLLLSPLPSSADELDDLLSGFGDKKTTVIDEVDLLEDGFGDETQQPAVEKEPEPLLPEQLELQGSISHQSTYSFSHNVPNDGQPDYRGLSMFRTRAELIGDISAGDWKIRGGVKGFYDSAYELSGNRELYTSAMLDEYESELELTELYLQGSLTEQLDLKLGRQVVVWGKSDNIRITDVLNPLDVRQPGMADIRDIRLPVTMTKLDYYIGDWGVSGIVVHEPRFNKTPVYNSDFYPGNQAAPPGTDYSWSHDNQQFALAANGIFSGWDFSWYLAYIYEQNGFVKMTGDGLRISREMSLMTGGAANVALGNFLIRGEVAYWDALNYSTLPDEEKSRIDGLIGLEYSGINDATFSIEFANRHILDFDKQMESAPDYLKENQYQYAIRYVHDFMHDTLHFTALASTYGLSLDGGGFERLQLEYDINDSTTITGGFVLYQSGDYLSFTDIGNNDRALLELEYRF